MILQFGMENKKMIKLFKPIYPNKKEILEKIEEILDSGWIINGKYTEKFEEEICKYLGCKNAVLVNSGTAALHLAVRNVFNQDKGKYVLTTPNTFIATNFALLYEGFAPQFVDIDKYGNIDLDEVDYWCKTLHNSLAGIMVVHYSGMPVDINKLNEISKKYDVPVIEDCAHAFSAVYNNGLKVGNSNNTCCFSLFAVKPMHVGEGGIITTNDNKLAEKARQQSWFNINRNTYQRSTAKSYNWDYNVLGIGNKYNYNEIFAAIGLNQIKYANKQWMDRKNIAIDYYLNLNGIGDIIVNKPNSYCSFHFWPIFTKRRNELHDYLKEKGIESGMHYKMNYNYSLFGNHENLPNADKFERTELTLPIGSHLTDKDLEYIVETIKEFYKGNKK